MRKEALNRHEPIWQTPHEISRNATAAHARSGLSLLAFAGARDLCYASLRRWRNSQAPILEKGSEARVAVEGRGTPGFIPVQMENDGTAREWTLRWPGGRSLQIPVDFDPEQLRRLLAVLEARS